MIEEMRMRSSQANRGMGFEEHLENLHEVYRLKKLALINKIPVKTVVQHHGEHSTYAMVTGKGLSDYLGVLPGGRAIALEAKQSKQKHFPIRVGQKTHNTIYPHQIEFLRKYEELGALALWIIHMVKHNLVFIFKNEFVKLTLKPALVDTKLHIEELLEADPSLCRTVKRGWNGFDYLSEIEDWI